MGLSARPTTHSTVFCSRLSASARASS
jgi:hypothetical protein